MRKLTLGLLLAVTLPTAVAAQEAAGDGKTYAALKLGVAAPTHDDMRNFEPGFALEAAVGYRVTKNIAFELGVGGFENCATDSYVDSGGQTVTVAEDRLTIPVTASARVILPLEKLQIFGLVGGGLYFKRSDVETGTTGSEPASKTDSDAPLGFHFGGGVDYEVFPRARVGIEARYVIGTSRLWGKTFHFDSAVAGGTVTYSL